MLGAITVGKQYIFRPSSTTPQEVLDFLEEETQKTSFPKLLVSLVEKEIARRDAGENVSATPKVAKMVSQVSEQNEGFDFSPANDSAIDEQHARIFEKLDEIEQKVDKVANIGLEVKNKVGSVDGHLFSSMKVIDTTLKDQSGILKKIQQAKSLSAVAVEQSVFASMPDRTIFTEMPEVDTANDDISDNNEAQDINLGADTDDLLKALLEA